MLVCAVATVLYVNIYCEFYNNNIAKISTEKQTYTGYISAVTNNDNTGYNITLVDNNGRETFGVSVYYGEGFALGDKVKITGKFVPFGSNPYTYYFYANDIKGKLNADSIEAADFEIKSVKYIALTARKRLLDSASKLYDDEYLAIVSAMGYSDKHLASDYIKDCFESAGISHALVVSGFHVGIIVLFLQMLTYYLPINKRIKNIITAVVVIVIMYIIGMTPSIIRAGLLAAVVLLTDSFLIEQDSLTTLSFIGLICILQNPFITRNIGAMLSWTSATGLILANSWCTKRMIEGIKRTLVVGSAVVISVIPVMSLAGLKTTWLSPLFNLVLSIPVSVVCILAFITPILELLPFGGILNTVLVPVNKYVINALMTVLGIIEKHFSFALLNLSGPACFCVTAAAFVACFVAYFQTENKNIRRIFVVAVSICSLLCYNLLNCNVVTVTAFDSGRETSFHISAKGKEYLVLSEWMTNSEAQDMLVSLNSRTFEQIYYCPKEFKNYTEYEKISNETINVETSSVYTTPHFTLTADIGDGKKLFSIDVSGCTVKFGHGKVTCTDSQYYFLGNDKPKSVTADEIYITGNIPKWMDNVQNITSVSSDLTIKINTKTGSYKTVKDVFNFGWQL